MKFLGVSGHFRSKIEVGDIKITRRNEMMYSCVLAGRMIDIGETSLQFYHAALNIPPPRSRSSVQLIQKDLLIASEFLDNRCMNSAKNEQEGILGLNSLTNCIRAVASYDGAYQIRSKKAGGDFSPYCFASAKSIDTGKVLAYEVACTAPDSPKSMPIN